MIWLTIRAISSAIRESNLLDCIPYREGFFGMQKNEHLNRAAKKIQTIFQHHYFSRGTKFAYYMIEDINDEGHSKLPE